MTISVLCRRHKIEATKRLPGELAELIPIEEATRLAKCPGVTLIGRIDSFGNIHNPEKYPVVR